MGSGKGVVPQGRVGVGTAVGVRFSVGVKTMVGVGDSVSDGWDVGEPIGVRLSVWLAVDDSDALGVGCAVGVVWVGPQAFRLIRRGRKRGVRRYPG